MPLHIKSKKIARGWIEIPEMDHVLAWMKKDTGSILETGAANGRLFSYLHHYKPNWKYTAVDTWDETTYLLRDYHKEYRDPTNRSSTITHDMFKKNCPFATDIKSCIWDFETKEKFDVVSIGAVGSSWTYEEWDYVLEKHANMTKPGGITIGRNITSSKHYAQYIQDIVAKKYLLKDDFTDIIKHKYDIESNGPTVISSYAYTKI